MGRPEESTENRPTSSPAPSPRYRHAYWNPEKYRAQQHGSHVSAPVLWSMVLCVSACASLHTTYMINPYLIVLVFCFGLIPQGIHHDTQMMTSSSNEKTQYEEWWHEQLRQWITPQPSTGNLFTELIKFSHCCQSELEALATLHSHLWTDSYKWVILSLLILYIYLGAMFFLIMGILYIYTVDHCYENSCLRGSVGNCC